MIIRILNTGTNAYISPNVARVVRVYNHRVPAGILESEFTQKGGILVGSGASALGELPPGLSGQYLTPDSSAALGLKYETPSFSVSDATNFLINGGFDFAQRQTPGTLTTISDNAYSADRWKILRENADLQYQRNDATGETGLTSLYYGTYKKITNAGKFMVLQIVEGSTSVAMRGKTVIFQVKMKASSAKTIRMAILELQTGGTIDAMPATPVSAWNVDSTDPTLGANLAVITGVESKSVTTAWTNFSVTVTVPATSKNLICAVWADADFTAADTLSMAEGGLFLGANLLAWSPRPIGVEEALCQRYYYLHVSGTDLAIGPAAMVSTTTISCSLLFPVSMRIAPTLDATSGTGYYRFVCNNTTDDFNSFTITRATRTACEIYCGADLVTSVNIPGIVRTNNASAKIGFSAEL